MAATLLVLCLAIHGTSGWTTTSPLTRSLRSVDRGGARRAASASASASASTSAPPLSLSDAGADARWAVLDDPSATSQRVTVALAELGAAGRAQLYNSTELQVSEPRRRALFFCRFK